MKILVYDFETQNLPLFDQPSDDPRQPHIVQAAAALVDTETRQTIASIDLIARPDGWTIPAEVARIHGITTERAREVGIEEEVVVSVIWNLWLSADYRLAHNEGFDSRIFRIALKRFMDEEAADIWKAGKAECTARLATPYCKLPPTGKMLAAGRKHYKTANLSEAHKALCGEDFANAHSAMADVQAAMRVYWAIKDVQQRREDVSG
jgi:DNA polymerase-3 subunit epsilon